MRDRADAERPSPERLSGLFYYDPESGKLFWRHASVRFRRPGSQAGRIRRNGYIEVGVGYRQYLAHRLIWAMQTGEWLPSEIQIDHINGNKADNSWVNLRKATPSQNKMNSGAQANSKSGVRGVHRCKQTGHWAVCISINGKQKKLGRYKTFDEAVAVRTEAQNECFGEFSHEREA